MINIAGINKESIVDGEGVRVVLYISGCLHNCDGCHNKQAQDFNYGKKLEIDNICELLIDAMKVPYINGLTLSGGDPLYSVGAVIKILRKIKKSCLNKNIWLYTGFKYEDIIKQPYSVILFQLIDVLVDGKFDKNLYDPTLCFRGSSNQRIIDVKKSLESDNIVLLNF